MKTIEYNEAAVNSLHEDWKAFRITNLEKGMENAADPSMRSAIMKQVRVVKGETVEKFMKDLLKAGLVAKRIEMGEPENERIQKVQVNAAKAERRKIAEEKVDIEAEFDNL